MTQHNTFCPVFQQSPLVEMRVALQLQPLNGFRSAHFGEFWHNCLLQDEWLPSEDIPPLDHDVEQFGNPVLNPRTERIEVDSLFIRSVFESTDGYKVVHFQPDRLALSISKNDKTRPSYDRLLAEFMTIYGKLPAFATKCQLGEIIPDLWELSYTNVIPQSSGLWESPQDWHRIFPKLFPQVEQGATELEWGTFEGNWYFTLPNQLGRVRVSVSKAVANQTQDIVLLVGIRARGSLGEMKPDAWASCLDLGHQHSVRLFYELASEEARKAWGYKSP